MNSGVKNSVRVAALALIVFVMSALFVCAGTPGSGDGSGGGSSIALSMVSSTPANGAAGVALKPTISCRFTHNVATAEVSAGNLSHMSLKKANGSPVALKTYVADVQIEFDKRQYLYAEPVSDLEPGTEYVLTLSAGIKAKNGMTTSAAQTVRFTTAGTAAGASGGAAAGNTHNGAQGAANADTAASTAANGANAAKPSDTGAASTPQEIGENVDNKDDAAVNGGTDGSGVDGNYSDEQSVDAEGSAIEADGAGDGANGITDDGSFSADDEAGAALFDDDAQDESGVLQESSAAVAAAVVLVVVIAAAVFIYRKRKNNK